MFGGLKINLGRWAIHTKKLLSESDPQESTEELAEDSLEIAEGGSASMAYGRLQFENLSDEARANIESKLFKYCELDTLAMAMITQAWAAHINKK